MKYLVMESEPGYAIVLDEEGRFLRVANRGYAVGETLTEVIEMAAPAAPKRRFGRYLAAVAMVACLLFCGARRVRMAAAVRFCVHDDQSGGAHRCGP